MDGRSLQFRLSHLKAVRVLFIISIELSSIKIDAFSDVFNNEQCVFGLNWKLFCRTVDLIQQKNALFGVSNLVKALFKTQTTIIHLMHLDQKNNVNLSIKTPALATNFECFLLQNSGYDF